MEERRTRATHVALSSAKILWAKLKVLHLQCMVTRVYAAAAIRWNFFTKQTKYGNSTRIVRHRPKVTLFALNEGDLVSVCSQYTGLIRAWCQFQVVQSGTECVQSGTHKSSCLACRTVFHTTLTRLKAMQMMHYNLSGSCGNMCSHRQGQHQPYT